MALNLDIYITANIFQKAADKHFKEKNKKYLPIIFEI
jgi:hypothetical protein